MSVSVRNFIAGCRLTSLFALFWKEESTFGKSGMGEYRIYFFEQY